jgi:hypothetical protein
MEGIELTIRMNFLLEPLLSTERNGILFQKEYLPDHIIKSDNGTFSALSQSSIFLFRIFPICQEKSSSNDLQEAASRDDPQYVFRLKGQKRIMLWNELIIRWLRKTGAFDKKLQSQTTPGEHHGNSNLGLGFNMPLGMGMGGGMDEDREGSPTPQSGRGKKRRGSADE